MSFDYGDLEHKFSFFPSDIVICVFVSHYLFVVDSNVMIYCYVVSFLSVKYIITTTITTTVTSRLIICSEVVLL